MIHFFFVKQTVKKNSTVISAGIELAPSCPKSDIVTILPYYQIFIVLFFAVRTTHRTRMRSSTAEEREAVMPDDGPQRPIKQVAKAVCHGPATRAWCGSLLLGLPGGVVTLFVLFCMLSDV